jgi:hypothetical protein
MWRLRLFFERIGWKPVAIAAAVLLALVAAAVAFAVLRGGDETSAPDLATAAPEESTNLYYLRAVAPETRIRGCSMWIRFIWKPDYHAEQYIDAPALITASGTGIQGTYQKRFGEKGVSIELGPVSLAGGYQVWSAKVTAIDRDPPGNDTTVQAAPPADSKCDTGS